MWFVLFNVTTLDVVINTYRPHFRRTESQRSRNNDKDSLQKAFTLMRPLLNPPLHLIRFQLLRRNCVHDVETVEIQNQNVSAAFHSSTARGTQGNS